MAGAYVFVALLMLLCHAPLLAATFVVSTVALYALSKRIWRAVLFSALLAPAVVLGLVFGTPALTGKQFELGCLRGGICCGGRPLNALNAPSWQAVLPCATPLSAPGS